MGSPPNGDDSMGGEPTQPWRRAIGREEPGGSSGNTRGEGVFEAGRKGLSRVDRDHPTEATKDERSSRQVVSSGGAFPLRGLLAMS